VALHRLIKNHVVRPVAHLDWSVSRPIGEIDRRFGLQSSADFLRRFATPNQPQYSLDLGAGNGTYVHDLEEQVGVPNYKHFGLCDALYFPLDTHFQHLLNFEAFPEAVAKGLTARDRQTIARALMTLTVLEPTALHGDDIGAMSYDQAALRTIRTSPMDILPVLLPKMSQLQHLRGVPVNISACMDANTEVHPLFTPLPPHGPLRDALNLLAEQPDLYLRDVEPQRSMPLRLTGMIRGSFADIHTLPNQTFDYISSCRGTVFYTGSYPELLTDIAAKLTTDGCYIGDDIRDYNGFYCRLPEIATFARDIKKTIPNMHVGVCMGPGLEAQDFRIGQATPLAWFMTASSEKAKYLYSAKRPAEYGVPFNIVPIEEAIRTVPASIRVRPA
jgi:hypothetical protein